MPVNDPSSSTPKAPTPSNWLKVLRPFLLGAVVGFSVAVGFGVLRRVGVFDLEALLAPYALSGWDTALVLLWFALAVVLHEIGHLVGGLRSGMSPLMIAFGPLRLTRGASGWRCSRQSLLHGLLGFVAMLPDGARPFVPQFRSLVLGGPLASLLLALLAAAAALPLQGRAEFHALALAACSTLILVMTATPLRVAGIQTDGAQLLDLARGGIGTQLKAIVLALSGQSVAGLRPRDLDADLIARGLALVDTAPDRAEPMLVAALHLLAAFHADDHGDAAATDVHMAAVLRLADGLQGIARAQFATELAWHAARNGNAAAAIAWLAQVRGGVGEPSDRLRAQAAIALAQQDFDAAIAQARAALDALPHSYDRGGAVWAEERLHGLIEQAQRTPPPSDRSASPAMHA